jgi:hypothetical protein
MADVYPRPCDIINIEVLSAADRSAKGLLDTSQGPLILDTGFFSFLCYIENYGNTKHRKCRVLGRIPTPLGKGATPPPWARSDRTCADPRLADSASGRPRLSFINGTATAGFHSLTR